jgi:diguanylate cyclase (GGDEF)-like protein
MLFRSLRHRIVMVFVGLLVLVMAGVLALVHSAGTRIAAGEARHELEVGAKVFGRLLQQNQRQLETAAAVLSADFAFREAIATQDQSTVRSVIGNHGRRIHAQVMMVAGTDGRMIASTQRDVAGGDRFPFRDLMEAAEAGGRSAGLRQMRNGHLYQVVLVPIMAPTRIAWVAMGFRVDDQWAREVAGYTGLDVHIVRDTGMDGPPVLLASSRDRGDAAGLAQALGAGGEQVEIHGAAYQSMRLALGAGVKAVLQLAVDQVSGPLGLLQGGLLVVVGIAIAVFALGSVMLAQRIVKPLNELSAAASRIAQGDYRQPLPRQRGDEIGRLAASFERMRGQVASREERIVRLAYVDQLTDLPNRTRFIEAFGALDPGGHGAVAVLNLHRFALINNALGHPVGDRLLRAVAGRLRGCVPEGGAAARLWGDQFAFLLPGADAEAARAFADAALASLRDPITLDGQRLDIGSAIGVALYPQDGLDPSTLLRRAELALGAAKRGHSSLSFAAEAGAEPQHEQLSLIGDMRAALANGEFMLYYQPKLALAGGRIVGAEALLRWRHRERGVVAPASFIPFAEQTGFIREITPWVLECAVRQIAQWQGQGLEIAVSANLSALDLLSPGLPEQVGAMLERHRVPATRLCLEITESALMHDPSLALAHLDQLAALGIKLSIDDYGVGQASLAYLKTLPVDELKLDRSFITRVDESPRNAAIVASTIMLSHALGLSVVAEGVESDAEQHWLAAHGCDVVQGYGIARPMPAHELVSWMAAVDLRQASHPADGGPAVVPCQLR